MDATQPQYLMTAVSAPGLTECKTGREKTGRRRGGDKTGVLYPKNSLVSRSEEKEEQTEEEAEEASLWHTIPVNKVVQPLALKK